jgi:ketosteroid isomerase-like protein
VFKQAARRAKFASGHNLLVPFIRRKTDAKSHDEKDDTLMKTLFRLLAALICTLAMSLEAISQQSAPKSPPSPISQPAGRFWPPDYKKPAEKPTPAATSNTPAASIRAVLDAQVAAWNAGKLEEFMAGYWRSPKLTFFSGGRKLSGWDATLERYRKNYQSEGKEMGKLKFADLDIQLLGASAAVVRGRYELTMSDGKELSGLYTLLFRKFTDGWKIIHDHTSSN